MTGRSAAVARAVEGVVAVVVFVALLAGALAIRGRVNPGSGLVLAGGAPGVGLAAGAAAGLNPGQLIAAGATALEAAHAKGRGGITFQIVQTATLHAKPGGPKIDVPDPNSRGSLGTADEYQVGSTIERGTYTSDGFWMEMRAGPAKGDKPDWDHATYEFGALVKDNKTFRNDGQGWYETDGPPGIGLDPATAALLPRLLRNATGPVDAGAGQVGGLPVRNATASAKIADAPGLMAVDAKPFTALTDPITFSFDDQGRLVQLDATTQNTNEATFVLLVDTVITFGYPLTADPIPDPNPVWSPPATPPAKG